MQIPKPLELKLKASTSIIYRLFDFNLLWCTNHQLYLGCQFKINHLKIITELL